MAILERFVTDPNFPAEEVEACIRDSLHAQAGSQAALRPGVASACEPEIDSLVVVEVICAVEELLGMSLPASFSPRGGYEDVAACVADLITKTRAAWIEHTKVEEHHEQ